MSKLEDDFLEQVRAAHLPEPVRELRFARHLGRQWRFDFSWEPQMVAVECNGGTFSAGAHSRGQGSEEDMVKGAVAVLLGWRVIQVNGHMIADRRAITIVSMALGGLFESGMRDAVQKCRTCDFAKTKRRQRARQKLKEEQ